MSQQIKALELSLGFPLFERRNRSFILTLAGEYFYQKSLGLVQTYEKLCKEAQKIAAGNQASLKIGILRTLSHEPLLQTLETFFQIYPQVSIEILSGNHEELFDWIRNEKVDLVLSDQRRAFSSEYVNLILITAPL